jgi:uncharacterized protein YbjT (DUF2867 family)
MLLALLKFLNTSFDEMTEIQQVVLSPPPPPLTLCQIISSRSTPSLKSHPCGIRIGARVVRLLSAKGGPVIALVRDPTAPAARALADLPAVRVARGDVLDPASLAAAVAGAAAVIDTHGMRPQRVTRISDLWARDPQSDPQHPAAVLFRCAAAHHRHHAIERVLLRESPHAQVDLANVAMPREGLSSSITGRERGEDARRDART